VGIADGTSITFKTVANQSVLTLANGGIQLIHLSAAVLQQVTAQSSVSLPATIIQKVGKSSPPGTLACTGQAVSRTTYAALFAEIGTSYGSGDGISTFNVPNFGGNYYIKF
jgi:phage-related tail fiber protein